MESCRCWEYTPSQPVWACSFEPDHHVSRRRKGYQVTSPRQHCSSEKGDLLQITRKPQGRFGNHFFKLKTILTTHWLEYQEPKHSLWVKTVVWLHQSLLGPRPEIHQSMTEKSKNKLFNNSRLFNISFFFFGKNLNYGQGLKNWMKNVKKFFFYLIFFTFLIKI